MTSAIFSGFVTQPLVRFIRQCLAPANRPRLRLHLGRELCFDLLDFVDCLLELEGSFHIPIPDEVPLVTVGELAAYAAARLRFRISF